MIDHTQLSVSAADHKAIVAFYEAALKPLGYKKLLAFGPNEEAVGFGDGELPHSYVPNFSPDPQCHDFCIPLLGPRASLTSWTAR